MNLTITPIGTIYTPYKEKFAVPRQPNLVDSVTASIHLTGDANDIEAVRGLAQFSHVWLLFLFDQNLDSGWRPTVRPPRLGGNERIGVLASRSPFRPNGIGMSVVPLIDIQQKNGQVIIEVGGVDLVNETPIIDIKPYVPYSDAIPDAKAGFATDAPNQLQVSFSDQALARLQREPNPQALQTSLQQILAQDPRPAYKKNQADDKIYAVHLFDFNVKFQVIEQTLFITEIESK